MSGICPYCMEKLAECKCTGGSLQTQIAHLRSRLALAERVVEAARKVRKHENSEPNLDGSTKHWNWENKADHLDHDLDEAIKGFDAVGTPKRGGA